MTTLPQTTGVRFPRVGSNRTPAIPALAQPHAAPAGGAGTGMTVADVLRVLRANLWLIIICSILGIILGYVINNYVFERFMKEYTARAILEVRSPTLIDPLSNNAVQSQDRLMLEVRQKTLAQKLLSPDLWRPLLNNPNTPVRRTSYIKNFENADGTLDQAKVLDDLQDKLGVVPNPSTELISVTLGAPTPDDAQTLLDGVIGQLITTEQGSASKSYTDERNALLQLQQRYDTLIGNDSARLSDLSSRLNSARGSSGNSNGTAILNTIELQALMQERIKKETDRNEAVADFQSYAAAYDAGQIPARLQMMMDANPSLSRLEAMTDDAQANLAAMRNTYAPGHRNVTMAEAQYNAMHGQLESKRESLRVSMGASMRDGLESQAKAAQADLDQTNQQIAEAERRQGELAREEQDYNRIDDELKVLKEKRSKVDDRLSVLDASTSRQMANNGTVRLWSPIDKPEKASFPNLKLSVGVGALLGLGLALGIAFLREMADTSVRSPRDITKVGQLNLLGMIPHTDDDPQAAAGELSLAISQSPNSIIAENFRQVRTRLQHAASLDTTRSLLVTSPGPGDGKTTVACNIAAGLALNGRKILLVDANFRRPALHSVFGVTNENGFGSVLSGAAQVEQVAKKTQVPNLDVLTTGPRPANPTELLESQLLTDFIDHALEEYDHVIFDAGPILLVSETVALAPRVDGVVTVVRAKANSRGLLQRMRDALRQLKAEHLGVVLNGVRQHTGGYYRRNIKNYYAYQNGNA